jgi:uncharacterized Zn-binding protein involved in type VI secretion
VGDDVRCPVSGVVFAITEASPSVELDGKPIYTCCLGCAAYLQANRDHVLRARGMV